MLGPGDVLGDRYRLDEFVASGGMGQVFRATDLTLARTVAVKVLLPGHTSKSEFGARFRAEARIMASIGHQGVVGVYDYGESPEGTLYLVMAFVDGKPLGEWINRDGTLPVDDTLDIVAQAADALQAAHSRGIIHRDVKPNNLLVNENGGVTLVDFGVARSEAVTSVTKVSAVIGTALYMSPEQASGKPVSPSTDIYALGAVAYHCLTGSPPFTGSSPLEIAIKHLQDEPPPLPESLPAAARALVERAMAKDPGDRFPTAAALAQAAREAKDGTVPLVRPAVTDTAEFEAVDDHTGRRPAWFPVAVGLALAVLAGGVVLAVWALSRDALQGADPGAPAATSAVPSLAVTSKAAGGPPTAQSTGPSASASASVAPSSLAPSSPAPQSEPPKSSEPPAPSTPPAGPSSQPPPTPDATPTQ
ncbi:protein kinase [Dactylosporangium sp. AC04546]|uniref:serine/threonine-protein kinase n=1 Tax=Dactylosporangium sp. AC04546 TaxID=2862460 RepID=UPI001EDCEC06|nr:serine/threonine-protein kinase [Dactylosporangium sp. AC04546]WVK81574.1 protein kinase [Dactylosporangium sp. AC04546]